MRVIVKGLLNNTAFYEMIFRGINELAKYQDLKEDGRLKVLPCKIGDPLYYIADEDDEGNEIPTVKAYPGGISAIIITASGIRVADSVELSQIVEYSNEIGARYAYLSPEDAAAAMKGAERC